MSPAVGIVRSIAGSRWVAVAVFAGLLSAFLIVMWLAITDVLTQRRELAEADNLLRELNARRGALSSSTAGGVARPGSPFIEGPTVTVAGASLLQRVAEAVNQVGGNIQSSQVDVQGNQARDGLVSLLISCEVDQPALQRLLYDLEAGMPFLYVDQLDVQMPQAAAANEAVSGRLRVILGVSGQWRRG